LSLVGLALAAGSTAKADFAYIGYYNSQTVTQLTVGSGSNTTITGATNFAGSSGSGYAPEAIMSVTGLPGAHSSEVLVVNNTAGTVEAYTTPTTANPTSTLISSNILKTSDGTASYSLAGCVIAGASNTNSSTGQQSGIYEFSTVTGKLVTSVAFNDAHDVTFHNGFIYATAYQSTTQMGVYQFNSNLTGMTQVVANTSATNGTGPTTAAPTANANDLYNATGMTFVGNNLFVGNANVNGGASGQSFVQEYSLAYGTTTTSSYVTTFTSSTAIINPFGMTTGPDGNVYISSLGTIGSTNGQITELNVSNSTLSTYLANGAYGGLAGNAPKYLMFQSEATVFVPEPGSVVLTGIGLAALGVIGRARKRKAVIS
jgi:hypothetical protein